MKRLLLFLAPLVLLSCTKDCPEPPKTPPGYVCGQAKNFAGSVHPGESHEVPFGMETKVLAVSRPMCEAWPMDSLEVVAVEGRLVRARFVRGSAHGGSEEEHCDNGETVFVTIFDIANLGITHEEREAGRLKLIQTPYPQ